MRLGKQKALSTDKSGLHMINSRNVILAELGISYKLLLAIASIRLEKTEVLFYSNQHHVAIRSFN